MIDELKRLRKQCEETIARIDAILPEAEEYASPVGKSLPVRVVGRCESVSMHALDRYRERTGSKKSDATICERIAARIASGKEMVLKEKYRVIELIAHGQSARYFRDADMLFVVESGVIITVHHGTADRWIAKENPPASEDTGG